MKNVLFRCVKCGGETVLPSGIDGAKCSCGGYLNPVGFTDAKPNSERRRSSVQHEALEQEQLFAWAAMMSYGTPELDLMYHIPNGGSRNKAEAARLRRQGVKAGVPDIHLPVARGEYHGLYIELKYGKNKTSEKQDEWIGNLRRQGYAAEVCYGWEVAADLIVNYLLDQKL